MKICHGGDKSEDTQCPEKITEDGVFCPHLAFKDSWETCPCGGLFEKELRKESQLAKIEEVHDMLQSWKDTFTELFDQIKQNKKDIENNKTNAECLNDFIARIDRKGVDGINAVYRRIERLERAKKCSCKDVGIELTEIKHGDVGGMIYRQLQNTNEIFRTWEKTSSLDSGGDGATRTLAVKAMNAIGNILKGID